MSACRNGVDLIDPEATRQIEESFALNKDRASVEVSLEHPIAVDLEQPTLSDLVHIPDRAGSKRNADDGMTHLQAAAEAAEDASKAEMHCSRASKRARVELGPLAQICDLDLVARYRTLKKNIYSMADDLHARSESERFILGKLLKQPFSEKLANFNLVRRELDLRGVDFNDCSKWPEVYAK